MDLRKLEIFVCVAELQSFSRAAEKLHMAQPAVSIAIKKLEQYFDTQLLQRIGKTALLTAEGQVALLQAKKLLDQAKDMQATMQSMHGLLSGEVTIACPSMLATYYLPSVLSSFLSQYPGLKVNVVQAGTQRIEQLIMQGKVEVGVITTNLTDTHLSSIDLIEEKVLFCTHTSHQWSGQREIGIKMLADEPLVLYEADYFIRTMLDNLCLTNNVQPDIRLETNFLPLIINAVKQQLGSTVGLSMLIANEPDIIGIPFEPAIPCNMAVAWHPQRKLSRANQCFVDWLVDSIKLPK